ncbi:MAG: MnhB domain-containing protein [Bacillota bacterium]
MQDFLLKSVSGYLIPFVQMYGLYVLFHGHLTPGGGFSGGMVIGLCFILVALAFGMERAVKEDYVTTFLYAGMCFVGVLKGLGMLFNIYLPLGTPGELFSSGWIFVITVGVGIVVACTILALYYALMEEPGGHGRHRA